MKQCVIRRVALSAVVLAFVALGRGELRAQDTRVIYSLDRLVEMLNAGATPRAVLGAVAPNCISFEVNPAAETRLRGVIADADAASALITGLRDVCRRVPSDSTARKAAGPIYNPAGAFLRGVPVPALGVFHVKRQVRGTIYVALALGGIGYGLMSCKREEWSEEDQDMYCAESQVIPRGVAILGVVNLIAALDAARIAALENRKAAAGASNDQSARGLRLELPVIVPTSRGMEAQLRLRF